MSLSIRRPLVQSFILILAGLCLLFILMTVKPLNTISRGITDRLFLDKPPSREIVIAGIDDQTLEEYGAWSHWSRTLHATAINNLRNAGALVIGIDILFTDVTDDDATLAESIREAGNVVLPLVGVVGQTSTSDDTTVLSYTRILAPTTVLGENSYATGHANINPDTDGTVRRMPLVIQDGTGTEYPAFSLMMLQSLFGAPLPSELVRTNGTIQMFSRDVPVDAFYNFRIDFSPDNDSRSYISYGDIIAGNFDPASVENKIILIGMTATGEQDKWLIPGSAEKIPGVYIHATVLDNILNQRFLTEAGPVPDFIILFVLLGISGVLMPRLRLRSGISLMVVLLLAFLGTAFFCFEQGHIVNVLYPLFIPPLCFAGNIMLKNTATLIENSRLKKEIESGYTGTIRALAASIEAKDHYTRGHSHRVTEYSLMTAAVLGFSEDEMKVLEYAAILHDIGKIGIPDTILTKPDRLDDEERALIERHPAIGAQIIEEVAFLSEVKELVLYHHERWDGTGYPEKLRGEAIPPGARILAVADSFDSMTSDRAYRSAMKIEEALDEVIRCSGTQFCPEVAAAFCKAYEVHRKTLFTTEL